MPGLGLGLGNGSWNLENGNRKREVAWHPSATVRSTLFCQFIEPVTFVRLRVARYNNFFFFFFFFFFFDFFFFFFSIIYK